MLLTLNERHAAEWSRTEHLLASIVDLLGQVAHNALVGPHADPKKLKRLKRPKLLPRPGQLAKKRRKATSEELQALFSSLSK